MAGKTILSGLEPYSPLTFAVAGNGFLYCANGIDPVKKWDGVDASGANAGIEGPDTAVTVASEDGSANEIWTVGTKSAESGTVNRSYRIVLHQDDFGTIAGNQIRVKLGAAPTALAAPATTPVGRADCIAVSPDGNWIAIATQASPYIAVHSFSGGVIGSKISDPATLPAGQGNCVAWAPGSDYIAIGHVTSPYITVYPFSGGAFGSKLSDPGTLPAAQVEDIAWSNAGDYIAVAHENSPYVTCWPFSAGFGSKLSDPGTLPAGNALSVHFSPPDDYIAVGHATSPYISVYPFSAGFGSKVSNPGTLPAGTARQVRFAPGDDYIAVAHDSSPYVSVYPWTTGFGTKVSDPATLPTGADRVTWSNAGDYIAFGASAENVYPWSSGFGTLIASYPPDAIASNWVAFDPNDNYIFWATVGTPYIYGYNFPPEDFTVDNVSIVERDSGADGTATPTSLEFSGNPNVTVDGSGTFSDWLAFSLQPGKDYLLIVDVSSNAAEDTTNVAAATGSYYYKAATNSYDQQTVTGFTEVSSMSAVVLEVEQRFTVGAYASLTGTYSAYTRYIDADGNISSLSPASSEVALSGEALLYTVAAPDAGSPAYRRQILRNTDGQATTYYVDIDTTDLTSTAFLAENTDAAIAQNASQSLFDENAISLLNQYDLPRADKPFLTYFKSRLFAYGESRYTIGSALCTNSSTTVEIVGGKVTEKMVGRLFYTKNGSATYEISAADEDANTLTLTSAFTGTTGLYEYEIRLTAGERLTLYWSEAANYEGFNPFNGVEVGTNGDEATGIIDTSSYLFTFQKRYTYRYTFSSDPRIDGVSFKVADRGCISHRCLALEGLRLYALDERGIWMLNNFEDQDLAEPIRDIFLFDAPNPPLKLNWSQKKYFHAMHIPQIQTIVWFVVASGGYLPRHAISFKYDRGEFAVHEFPFPVGASMFIDGNPSFAAVGGKGTVYSAFEQGTLDVLDPDGGNTQLTVESAGPMSVTVAETPHASAAGAPLAIYDGTGKQQTRIVAAISGTTIYVTQPWSTMPDSTSVVQLGAIPWDWKSLRYRWVVDEMHSVRALNVGFIPAANAQMDFRLFKNHGDTPENFGMTYSDGDGVATTLDDPDAVVDLGRSNGYASVRVDEGQQSGIPDAFYSRFEMRGFSSPNPVRLTDVSVEGAG